MFEHGNVEVQWRKIGRFDVTLGEKCEVRLGTAHTLGGWGLLYPWYCQTYISRYPDFSSTAWCLLVLNVRDFNGGNDCNDCNFTATGKMLNENLKSGV